MTKVPKRLFSTLDDDTADDPRRIDLLFDGLAVAIIVLVLALFLAVATA